MKKRRQDAILALIAAQPVSTQKELTVLLRQKGFHATQATVSRDIRELNLRKVQLAPHQFGYAPPSVQNTQVVADLNSRYTRMLSESLVSVGVTGALIVVKTLSGTANVVGEALDTLSPPELLGTIAGDNTLFAAADSPEHAEMLAQWLRNLL